MGLRMGTPYFEMREQQQQGLLWWRSSNYTLYQDMMRRITAIVRDTFPDQEIYSIDECYCDITGFKYYDLEQVAVELRKKILQYTGVPVCIGIAATKTLAKVANKIAKKYHRETGVCYLDTEEKINTSLQRTEIDDVWGIGPRYAIQLIKAGVNTAFDFIHLPEDYVLKLMTIQGRRTWRELRGQRCIPMEYEQPDKEGISTGRSFGIMETRLEPMEEALAFYVANAGLKLRAQNSVCAKLFIYVQTSLFAVVENRYSASLKIQIDVPTANTAVLIKAALAGLKQIFVQGYRYQKVGVELYDLRPNSQVQASLFEPADSEKETKMQRALKIIDQLNKNYGKDTIRYAVMGYEKKWIMRQEFLSKKYTTRIEDVIVVKAY